MIESSRNDEPLVSLNDVQGDVLSILHLIDLDDVSLEDLMIIFRTTKAMKEVMRSEEGKRATLTGDCVATLFYESSTRTRASFELAAKRLGAHVINVSSLGSSVDKGESLSDTASTLESMGADVIVIRHSHSGAPYLLAKKLQRALIINAGDGQHAHPTQALLDIYTMWEKFGPLKSKKIVIVGDVIHSRVTRSNILGLSKMGAQVVLCGPPTLLPSYIGHQSSKAVFPNVELTTNVDEAVVGADVVMALRLQTERQKSDCIPSIREYTKLWQVNAERMSRANQNAIVMHPGPMNGSVEISKEVVSSEASLINDQVGNGVAIRMALLYLMRKNRE